MTNGYRRFLQMLFVGLNAGRRRRLAEEIAVTHELPERPVALLLTSEVGPD
jgi:hypothetical protein